MGGFGRIVTQKFKLNSTSKIGIGPPRLESLDLRNKATTWVWFQTQRIMFGLMFA